MSRDNARSFPEGDSGSEDNNLAGDASHHRSTLLAGVRVVGLCTLASRVLGLLRDTAMARLFGAGPILDAFTVSFQIPNLARQLLGEGALTAAFLPAFLRAKEQGGVEGACELTSATFVRLSQLLLGIVIVSEAIIGLLLYGAPVTSDASRLLQLLALFAPYVILVCLTALMCAALQSLGRFFWPAILPVLLNLFWLLAVEVVRRLMNDEEAQIRWIATSLLGAGMVQLAVPVVILHCSGYRWSSTWRQSLTSVRGVFHSMIPVVTGVTLSQANAFIDRIVAWQFSQPSWTRETHSAWWPVFESGTASALYLGQRMYQFPLGVFGVALGTVLFPILTRHAEVKDMYGFRVDMSLGVRLAMAIGMPASVGLMLVAGPLSTALFQYGKFDSADAGLTAHMIRAYGCASWAFILLLITNRGFYALHDRQTPVTIGKWAVCWNVLFSALLIYPMHGSGLAWGTSLATMVQAVYSLRCLSRQCGGLEWSSALTTLAKSMAGCLLLVGVVTGLQSFSWPSDSVKQRLVVLTLQCAAGGAAYLTVARLMHFEEPWMLLRRQQKTRGATSAETPHRAIPSEHDVI